MADWTELDEFGTTAEQKKDQVIHATLPSLLAITIMSHPNLQRIGDVLYFHKTQVYLSRTKGSFVTPGQPFSEKTLADPFISRAPIILKKEAAGSLTIKNTSSTIVEVNGALIEETTRFSPNDIKTGIVMVLAKRVVLFIHKATPPTHPLGSSHGMIGCGREIVFLRQEIDQVADLSTPVLLRGQSGTGKELVARAIHKASGRTGPFVSVNVGAIPASLAAAELFGAAKGAYTGADRPQLGYFRSASKGTLFLDEIGEATPELQVLLLRALETGEIAPVGTQINVPFEARLLAATDANLEKKMEEDSFKSPLFHRLAGYEICLPPLSQRLEDFGRLFLHFAREQLLEIGEGARLEPGDPYKEPWLPTSLMVRLLNFSWPGNIRQLRNTVRQLVIGCRGETHLRLARQITLMLEGSPKSPSSNNQEGKISSGEPNREQVLAAMAAHSWDIKAASDALGISRGRLYLLIDKIPELNKAGDLSLDEIDSALKQNQGNLQATAQQLRVSLRGLRRRINQLGKLT